MKLNKLKKTKNIFIYLLSLSASAVGIFLNFFLARVLEADSYGKIQYLVALATTISQFLIFGMNTFLIREAKNENQKGEVFNKCFSLYIILITFFIPIVFYVLHNHVTTTSGNLYLTISVMVVALLMGVNSLVSAYYQGSGKYHLTITFESLLPKLFLLLTAIVFTVIGKLSNFQQNYLVFYIIFYSMVAISFVLILFRKVNLHFDKSELKSIFFFFGVTVTYSLGNNLTKVLQGGLYRNDVALGIISVSISIVSLARVFTSVLDNMVKPIFAKQKRENDIEGLLDTYRFDTRMNSYVIIPLYIFLALHPSRFLSIFGSSYLVYPNILTIIVLANAVNELTGPNGTMLAMTGKEKWELMNGFIYFAVYFVSIFILSSDKIYGLCYALLISQVAVNIAKYVEVWLIYKKMPLNGKTLMSLLIILAVNFAVIFAFKYLTFGLWIWILLGVVAGALLVVANFAVLSLYRIKDFKRLINLRV